MGKRDSQPIKGDVDAVGIRRVSGEFGSADGLVEIPLVGHDLRYLVRVDLAGPTPRLTELRMICGETADEIDPSAVRQVPVRRLAYAAARFIKHADGAFSVPGELSTEQGVRGLRRPDSAASRHLDDDHYKRIAAMLLDARQITRSPRQHVAKACGVKVLTVDRWIAEAKERRFLPRDWAKTTESPVARGDH